MRRITGLSVTEGRGCFVDREDMELVVEVSPARGDVVLNEQSDEGELQSVCIPREAVDGFELRQLNGVALLVLRFRRGDRVLECQIGQVEEDTSVLEWLEHVNRHYPAAHPAPQPAAPPPR